MEFNNSDRPGGADGTMNIETGVFTASTSGYYIITFSTIAIVSPGGEIIMWLYHNGAIVEESMFQTRMEVGDSGNFIYDQGSRTAVSIAGLKLISFFIIQSDSSLTDWRHTGS